MSHYLYLKVEGIQRFVFASPKLKIIRGGSALLDHFNRVEMREAAEGKGGKVVFAGGGHCLASGLSQSDAKEIGARLGRELRRKTDGQVSLAWAVAPEGGDWRAVWADLHADLKRRSLEEAIPVTPPLPPFVALCSSCGVSPARELRDIQDRQRKPLCGTCWSRFEEAEKSHELKRETLWQRLRPHLGRYEHRGDNAAFRELLPDREFEQIVALGSGPKYLAYLYCDGNGMGRSLSAATSAKEYGAMSRRVDDALHKAVAEAILRHCPPDRCDWRFGAEVLLLGGDDLIVALPADRGAAFTQTVLEVFSHETKGDFRLSAGLVFAPFTTPITILQQAAESLLHSAKRYAYLDEVRKTLRRSVVSNAARGPLRPPAVGYVDFQELTSSQVDLERRHAVTCRPYRLDDFATLRQRTRDVHSAKVPRGRLHALAEAVRGSKREAQIMTQLVVGRARDRNHQQWTLLRDLLRPFQPPGTRTPLRLFTTYPDAIEEDDLPFDLYRDADPDPDPHRWSAVLDALELIDHLGSDGGDA